MRLGIRGNPWMQNLYLEDNINFKLDIGPVFGIDELEPFDTGNYEKPCVKMSMCTYGRETPTEFDSKSTTV